MTDLILPGIEELQNFTFLRDVTLEFESAPTPDALPVLWPRNVDAWLYRQLEQRSVEQEFPLIGLRETWTLVNLTKFMQLANQHIIPKNINCIPDAYLPFGMALRYQRDLAKLRVCHLGPRRMAVVALETGPVWRCRLESHENQI